MSLIPYARQALKQIRYGFDIGTLDRANSFTEFEVLYFINIGKSAAKGAIAGGGLGALVGSVTGNVQTGAQIGAQVGSMALVAADLLRLSAYYFIIRNESGSLRIWDIVDRFAINRL